MKDMPCSCLRIMVMSIRICWWIMWNLSPSPQYQTARTPSLATLMRCSQGMCHGVSFFSCHLPKIPLCVGSIQLYIYILNQVDEDELKSLTWDFGEINIHKLQEIPRCFGYISRKKPVFLISTILPGRDPAKAEGQPGVLFFRKARGKSPWVFSCFHGKWDFLWILLGWTWTNSCCFRIFGVWSVCWMGFPVELLTNYKWLIFQQAMVDFRKVKIVGTMEWMYDWNIVDIPSGKLT